MYVVIIQDKLTKEIIEIVGPFWDENKALLNAVREEKKFKTENTETYTVVSIRCGL